MSDSSSLDEFLRMLNPIIGPAEEFVEQCCQPIAGGHTECHRLGFGCGFLPSREQLERCLSGFSALIEQAFGERSVILAATHLYDAARITSLYVERAEVACVNPGRQDDLVRSLDLVLSKWSADSAGDCRAALRNLRQVLDVPTCEAVAACFPIFKNSAAGVSYFRALQDVLEHWPDPAMLADAVKRFLDTQYECAFAGGPLVAWLERHLDVIAAMRCRQIQSLSGADRDAVCALFSSLLNIWGAEKRNPIAVGQSLHFLAPDFLPFWSDRSRYASNITSSSSTVGVFGSTAEELWDQCSSVYWHYTSRMNRYAQVLRGCGATLEITGGISLLQCLIGYAEWVGRRM